MFAGGIADKLGNRYEAKWLVRHLLGVIGGHSDWVRFEGISPEFSGFEFAVGTRGVVHWHQTKISNPNGNWTIAALAREGVLSSFSSRLEASPTDHCVFVSQEPAKDLCSLTEKSKIANTVIEFEKSLGKIHSDAFRNLKNEWQTDENTVYDWLRRCNFTVIAQSEIDSFVEAYADIYFSCKSSSAFSILREFLEQRINKKITTESVRRDLTLEGKILFKEWSLDPTLREQLSRETKDYLGTYSPFGAAGETIVRQQSMEIVEDLLRPNGPAVVLLTGVAGSGKSGVVRAVINHLQYRGVTHLALRVDHHLQCTTRSALGREVTGRDESPTTTLKGVEPIERSVLIIDQVDAISEISGRNGAVKKVVMQLVDDARNYSTVRVLVVCRSFDLESDARLKALRESLGVVHVDVPLPDWAEDVEPLLISKNIFANKLTQKQQELLCLPLNLAMFLEIDEGSTASFVSRNDLFDRLLDSKDRSIRRDRSVGWGVASPLLELAQWMSEQQVLDAPREVLSSYSGALDILSSEGLIVRSRDRVNFFHESFFDYIYARAFCRRTQSVLDLLCTSEQHLFRRTQVRQILETLRDNDPRRYMTELRDLLSNMVVRYHIKVAIAQWLGSQPTPSVGERDIVLTLDDGDGHISPLIRYSVLTTAGWFDRLDEVGWIEAALANDREERRRPVLWWLASISGERSARIAAVLERWWGEDQVRAASLLEWFGWMRRQNPGPELVDLCERVLRTNPSGLFGDNSIHARHLLLSTWAGEHADLSSGILQAYFDAWFDAHPDRHPFERDELRELDTHALGEMAKKSPAAFLNGTVGALSRAVDVINDRLTRNDRDSSFKHRSFTGHRFGADAFLDIFRLALARVALEDPKIAEDILCRLDPARHEVFTHLHLEIIKINGEYFGKNLVNLLSNPHLLEAGWDGAEWKSFADAAKSAFRYLNTHGTSCIEATILTCYPELKHASSFLKYNHEKGQKSSWPRSTILHYLNRSGFVQFCILQTIGTQHLGSTARDRLFMLRRKFPGTTLPQPDHNEAHWVGSPIKRRDAARMTDAHWLGAIEHYDKDEIRTIGHSYIDGGARELAGELQHLSKEYPGRFAALAAQIPDNVNPVYLRYILCGLAESENVDESVLKLAVRHAHAKDNKPFGEEIARIFDQYPAIAADLATLEVLLWYVEHGDANEDEAAEQDNLNVEVVEIDDLIERAGKMRIRQVNGPRGWAAEVLATVLWKVPEAAHRAWEVLDQRIASEDRISIRCSLLRPLVPLYNHDRHRCAELVERLCEGPGHGAQGKAELLVEQLGLSLMALPNWMPKIIRTWAPTTLRAWEAVRRTKIRFFKRKNKLDVYIWLFPLATPSGASFLPYLIHGVPIIGRKLLYRLLHSGDENMRMIAAWHIFRLGFQHNSYAPLADDLLQDGPSYRRLAASVATHAVTHDEFRYRAESQVAAYFDDTDQLVRTQAARVFPNIDTKELNYLQRLAERFVESRAFGEQAFGFFRLLSDATIDISALVIRAAEQVMSDLELNGTAGGRRHTDLHQLQELIKKEYSSSEHAPALRSRLLDVIDAMLVRDLYGVDEIVKIHER